MKKYMTFYSRILKIPFEDVLNKVSQNLERQGFAIITTIDVQNSLQEDLSIRFRKYKILGACNPQLAYRAINLEAHAGMMVPCHIVVQEHENGEVEVSAINPLESISQEERYPGLLDLARETGIRLRAAVDFIERDYSGRSTDAITHEGNRHFSCFIPG